MKKVGILVVVALGAAMPAAAVEKVALRTAGGQFLQVTTGGFLRPATIMPTEAGALEPVPRGKEQVALRAADGRFVIVDAAAGGRLLRLGVAVAQPGDAETLQLVSAAEGRFALRSLATGALAVVDPADQRPADPKAPGEPAPRETAEILRLKPLPLLLQTTLAAAIQGLAAEELNGKKYDKTTSKHIQKFIELPAPTVKDLKHKKKVQVLGVTQEHRVQAELDGPADIRVVEMLYLPSYGQGGAGVVLLEVHASLPVRGHAQYKIDKVLSASTGYRAKAQLSTIVEVRVKRAGGDVSFGPFAVRDLRAALAHLELSNDLLDAVRGKIKDLINEEVAHNHEKLRASADRSVQKAMAKHEVKLPLIGYLMGN